MGVVVVHPDIHRGRVDVSLICGEGYGGHLRSHVARVGKHDVGHIFGLGLQAAEGDSCLGVGTDERLLVALHHGLGSGSLKVFLLNKDEGCSGHVALHDDGGCILADVLHLRIAFGHRGSHTGRVVVLIGTDSASFFGTLTTADVGGDVVERQGGEQVAVERVLRLENVVAGKRHLLVYAVSGTRSSDEGGKVARGRRGGTEEGLACGVHHVVLELDHVGSEVGIVVEVHGVAAGLVLDDVVHHADVAVAVFYLRCSPEGSASVGARHTNGVVGNVHVLHLAAVQLEGCIAGVERSQVDDVIGNDDGSVFLALELAQVHHGSIGLGSHVEGVARNLERLSVSVAQLQVEDAHADLRLGIGIDDDSVVADLRT